MVTDFKRDKEGFYAEIKAAGLWEEWRKTLARMKEEARASERYAFPEKVAWEQCAHHFSRKLMVLETEKNLGITKDEGKDDDGDAVTQAIMNRVELSRADFEGRQESTFNEDVEWARRNVALSDVTVKDAPSPGAASMLELARTDPKTFHQLVYKVCDDRESREAEKRFTDDGSHIVELVDRLRRARAEAISRGNRPVL